MMYIITNIYYMKWFLFLILFTSSFIYSQAPCDFKLGNYKSRFSLESSVISVCFNDTFVANDCCNILRNYFGFRSRIDNVYLDFDKFSTNNTLFLDMLMPRMINNNLTIYVVGYDLIWFDTYVKGISGDLNYTVFIDGRRPDYKSTLIHEVGHQLGLDHCDDPCCVMYSAECVANSTQFCIKCLSYLNQ